MTIFKKNKNQNIAEKGDSNKTEYISLQGASNQGASKLCNYSQEYLSLRARQGKLKALKLGRDWVTKKEWVKEYVREAETYKNNLENNFKVKKVPSPENLPVEPLSAINIFQPQFITAMALVIIIVVAGIFFGKVSFKNTYLDTKDFSQGVYGSLGNNLKPVFEKAVKGYFVVSDFLKRKIDRASKAISRLRGKETGPGEVIPEPAKEGLVVIPSTEKDEETKEKIKEAFSDEVRIETADKTSGIIIPVFREREGEKYLYILVPIKN